jgi:hypothetical protein
MQNILPDAAEHGCEGEDGGHAHAYKGKNMHLVFFTFTFIQFWKIF